jgi:hypothetical protein
VPLTTGNFPIVNTVESVVKYRPGKPVDRMGDETLAVSLEKCMSAPVGRWVVSFDGQQPARLGLHRFGAAGVRRCRALGALGAAGDKRVGTLVIELALDKTPTHISPIERLLGESTCGRMAKDFRIVAV